MSEDAGSVVLAAGSLFGKDEYYPPTIINCVIDFTKGAPTKESVIQAGKRLLQVKRMRSIFVPGAWLFDGKFVEIEPKLEEHLFIHVAKRDEQWALVNKFGQSDIPLSKPLWEMHYIHDEEFETAQILLRVNHGIGDGVRLSSVFFPIFFEDKDGGAIRLPKFKKRKDKGPSKGFVELLKGKWEWFVTGLKLMKDSSELSDSPTCIHTPKVWKAKEEYAFTRSKNPVDLNLVKKIKTHEGVTVNDVLLTAATQSFREYMIKRGQKFDENFRFRCLCAIGIPSEDDSYLKNNFSIVAAEAPVECADRKEALKRVKKSMDTIKNSSAIALAIKGQELTCYLGLDSFANKALKDTMLNHSFIYSNVPGIQETIYFAGKEVNDLASFFTNSLTQIILLSYNNKVTMSLTTDTAIIEAPEELTDGFSKAIEDWANDISA